MYCTNEHGSALFDSTLGDPELLEEMYKNAVKEQSSKLRKDESAEEYHPARRGYTREVEATLDVADHLVALRAELGKWRGSSTRFSPRPVFPAEAVQEKLRMRNRTIRDEKIKAAQARWSNENGTPAR